MFKLEFDPSNRDLAAAIGQALLNYGRGQGQPVVCEVASTEYEDLVPVAGFMYEEEQLADLNLQATDAGQLVQNLDGRTAEPVRTVESTTTTPAGAVHTTKSTTTTETPAKVDGKGVAFDPIFCANAKIPFYASGKLSGQWKKKPGFAQEAYDMWYVEQLKQSAPADPVTLDEVNTAAAFGATPAAAAEPVTFTDAGQFVGWISEQQAGGRLTQLDIDGAYKMTSTNVQDLFNPATFDAVVAPVYAYLKPLADKA